MLDTAGILTLTAIVVPVAIGLAVIWYQEAKRANYEDYICRLRRSIKRPWDPPSTLDALELQQTQEAQQRERENLIARERAQQRDIERRLRDLEHEARILNERAFTERMQDAYNQTNIGVFKK